MHRFISYEHAAAALAVALTAVLAMAGCLGLQPGGPGGPCADDGECGAGSECTRTGECALAGTTLSVRITWLVDGQMPDPDVCEAAGIDELEVVFEDLEGQGRLGYRPVRCTLAQIYFNRMPPHLDLVALVAFSAGGRVVAYREALLQGLESVVEFNIEQ